MSTPSRLPDEIVHLILSNFDSIQVAKLELVCKQWKNVARSYKSLWKDGLFLKGNRKLSTKSINRRLIALTKRSGGTIDHLGARLDLTDVEIDEFNDRMLAAKVKNLWLHLDIKLSDYGSWEDDTEMGRYIEVGRDKAVVRKTLDKIAKCANLKSLHIEYHDHILGHRNPERFSRNLASKPIAQCKLERLTLVGFRNATLFEDDSLFHMLEKARVIEIMMINGAVPEKHALRLLEGAKDTLEECQLDILQDGSLARTPLKCLEFPHLFRLYLLNNNKYSSSRVRPVAVKGAELQSQADVVSALSGTSLKCPRLKDVYLAGEFSQSVCQDLLTKTLETLQIDLRSNPSLSKASLLKNCIKLKKLILENIGSYHGNYCKDLKNDLSFVPLEELVITEAKYDKGDALLELIKARKEDPKLTTIKRLYLLKCSKLEPEIQEWLNENVENFQELTNFSEYDSNQRIHFYTRKNFILHRRNYIHSPMIISQA